MKPGEPSPSGGARPPSPEPVPVVAPPPLYRPVIRRKLRYNLSSTAVLEKIREAERMSEAGERELAFYLSDLRRRKLYKKFKCDTFLEFVRKHTGVGERKGQQLAAAGRALRSLPALDEAFARGEVYWSSIRAIITVATPRRDREWADYARCHTVEEVERKVASCRRGDGPGHSRNGRGPRTRFPYRFSARPELHQAIESLTAILSKERGDDVTVEETLAEALKIAIAVKIDEDGKDGKDRVLPVSYRLVIHGWPATGQYAVATSDGPVPIEAERARKLAEGAEVLDLREDAPSNAGDPGEKAHTCAFMKTQVVPGYDARKNSDATCPEPAEADPRALLERKVEHAANLSTPDRPAVPLEARDDPNDAEIRKRVLSRCGYFCRVPGCKNLAERCHHIENRIHGGKTTDENEDGFCLFHHDCTHDGEILVSGKAGDLRISDVNGRPLLPAPGTGEGPVALEVEETPADLLAEEGDGPGPDGDRDGETVRLPAEVDRPFWPAHRQRFEWSERRRMFVFHGEEMSEARPPADPAPPAAPAPAAPGKPGSFSSLGDFEGQRRIVENLSLALRAAKMRGDLPQHVLLTGPAGLGKTTLAHLLAFELGTTLHQTQGPSLLDPGALLGILLGLEEKAALFIDEIHRVPAGVSECLYQALDASALSLPVACGAEVRTVTFRTARFLLIGATTEEGDLPKPLLSRFGIKERLDLYAAADLERLAVSTGRSLGVDVTADAAEVLARGARGTPRLLIGHVARARDLAQVEGKGIDGDVARRSLRFQGIDPSGLNETDRKILRVLLSRGRPIGLRSLADLIGENSRTLVEVYEPHLLREGFIARTMKGRVVTDEGRKVLFRPSAESA